MAQKKSRQTFEKMKREQAVREKRALKAERKAAARMAKALGLEQPEQPVEGEYEDGDEQAAEADDQAATV